jgi:protein O-GlcNAc transferase
MNTIGNADMPPKNMLNRFKNLIAPSNQTVIGHDANFPDKKLPTVANTAEESATHKQHGDAHLQNGDLENAKACYQRAIALDPNYAKAHSNLGFVLMEQRHYGDAELSLKTALTFDPNIADAHYMLGTIYQNQDRLEDTLYHFRRALELDPDLTFAYRDLCYLLFQHGKVEEAKEVINKGIDHNPRIPVYQFLLGNLYLHAMELDKAATCYRTALSIQPAYVEAHFNLGIVHQEQGDVSAAIASYQKAIALAPDFVEAHYRLGTIFFNDQHLLPEAEARFRHALEIKPDFADARLNLGNVLKDMGRLDEAESSYVRLLELIPDFAEAHSNLGNVLKDLGRLDEAVISYQRALQIKPDLSQVHSNLGNTFRDMGRLTEAEASYRRALQLKPDNADAHVNLGAALQDMKRFVEAEASYRQALQLKPDHADAHSNLAVTLREQNRLVEAEASFRRALQLKPDHVVAHSSLLYLYAYHAFIDPDGYLVQAHNWEQASLPEQDRQAARHRVFQRPALAGRRLRVGYVSGDFRQHAVSHFIEQLFTHHDRSRIELFAYSNNVFRDAVTERLQALTNHWALITGMRDTAVRDRVEADGIDVLIDLSGHTALNRMGVFARRAAPVQAYYLGYFASTGLTEMDYWIGDDILTPPETDNHFSEQVWRLPRVSWSYDGKDAPLPDVRPAPDDTVWIGSFNQLGKLTPATLDLWAKVLHALPEGRLLLKTKELTDTANRQRILDVMASHAITQDRIELQDSRITPSWREHMAYYNRLDIVLDPVGAMGGVTTTCDALWMGAPVITLEGDRVTSRATASILSAIDRAEWIAHSEAEYLDKVVALARSKEQRKAYRYSQRERMARSPLCDAKDLAINLEQAYAEMFDRWLSKRN